MPFFYFFAIIYRIFLFYRWKSYIFTFLLLLLSPWIITTKSLNQYMFGF